MLNFKNTLIICILILTVLSCKKSSTNSEPKVITFPDSNFELLIREVLEIPTGDILDTNLEALIYLDGSTRNITDITGIEYCINLDTLRITNNQIEDISMLAGLDGLIFLSIGTNPITDIRILSNLINLKRLHMGHIQATDFSTIASLTLLEIFGVAGNNLIDIGFLKDLQNLKTLYLSTNLITDIKPLIDNQGIGSDDYVRLRNNPLSVSSINTYIPELESRGVTIDY
ncbi:leucine-rich repeat domain-containing protein [Candidatus Neomarinimicrobiota bacterium]